MKKIVICGNYGGINTGDEAMLEGLLYVLRDKADITVLSHNPRHTQQFHGVKSQYVFPMGIRSMVKNFFNGELKKTKKAIKDADLFILGGGGLFTDEESKSAPYMWAAQLALPQLYKIPYVMLGQSVGPIKEEKAKKMLAGLFEKAHKIILRDKTSKQTLRDIGVQKQIEVTGDLALILKEKYKDSYSYTGSGTIFIPRDWGWSNSKIEKIKKILKETSGGNVKILSFNRDYEAFEKENHKRTSCLMPKDALNQIEKAELVVSMRLHGNILAATIGTPFVALSYSSKVRAFCEEVGNKAVLDFNDLDEAKLKNLIKESKDSKSIELKDLSSHLVDMLNELST